MCYQTLPITSRTPPGQPSCALKAQTGPPSRTQGYPRVSLKRGSPCLFALLVCIASFAATPPANAQAGLKAPDKLSPPAVIIIGFLGGFVRPDDDRHIEVQMIHRLAKDNPGVRAVVFDNRHVTEARKAVLHWLDSNNDGQLTDAEKHNTRIILLGHSWGGSAAIRLANELNQSRIPVFLTIQLDSINKGPGRDCVIPPNVEQALNFYQTRGLAHGCSAMRPVDATRTKILGNFVFDYAAQPAGCSSYSWLNRHVLKTHNAMDCDPQVWSMVEKEIWTTIQGSGT